VSNLITITARVRWSRKIQDVPLRRIIKEKFITYKILILITEDGDQLYFQSSVLYTGAHFLSLQTNSLYIHNLYRVK